MTTTTPTAEQQATKETSGGLYVWRDISTAPKDGSLFVATGHNYGLYSEVRHTCVAQWFQGCWMEASDWNETSELKYLTHWMPLPSPPDDVAAPAEQQAQPGAVYAELPQPDSWFHFTAQFWENKLRDFADRTHALRMQAAPKAAPGEPTPELQRMTASRAAFFMERFLREEKLLGPNERAAVQFALNMLEAAPRQEAQEPGWDGKLSDAMQNALDALYLECGPGITRDITHQVQKECEAIYTSYTTMKHMHQAASDKLEAIEAKQPQPDPFAAPPPAPAPLSDDVVRDAARYRWLRDTSNADDPAHMIALHIRDEQNDASLSGIDAAIDAAIAAQGGK